MRNWFHRGQKTKYATLSPTSDTKSKEMSSEGISNQNVWAWLLQKPFCSYGMEIFLLEDDDDVCGQGTLPNLLDITEARLPGLLGACLHGWVSLACGYWRLLSWTATCLHAGLPVQISLHLIGVLYSSWMKNERSFKSFFREGWLWGKISLWITELSLLLGYMGVAVPLHPRKILYCSVKNNYF